MPVFHWPSTESTRYMLPFGVVSNRTSSKMKNSGSGPKYAVSATPVEKRCSCAFWAT